MAEEPTLTRLVAANPHVEVWAGGGVVLRSAPQGPEILLVHRPHRLDWSLPKGKLKKNESLEECAVREVREETGLECRRHKLLPMVEYTDSLQRAKAVIYWTMSVVAGRFEPNDEVDAQGWFDLASAVATLTYPHDARLLLGIDPAILASEASRGR